MASTTTTTTGRGRWTRDAVRGLGLTTDVATAGSILGIGRSKAYELAGRGEFPVNVLRIGRRLVVPTSALLAALGASGESDAGDSRPSRSDQTSTSGRVPVRREPSSEILSALRDADDLDKDVLMLIGYIVATGRTGHAISQLGSLADRVGSGPSSGRDDRSERR